MPRSTEEIEKLLRSEFPVLFKQSSSIENEIYIEKKNSFTEYALAVTGPFLSADTIRYQSILLYSSLIFVSINFFSLKDVKIGDDKISVDSSLILVYSIFVVLVSVIFLMKCYIDHQRGEFIREKNAYSIVSLQNLNSINSSKALIEQYFWLETYDAIGAAYDVYKTALDQALGRDSGGADTIKINSIKLNFEDMRNDQELCIKIKAQQSSFSYIERRIKHDSDLFCSKLNLALSRPNGVETQDMVKMDEWTTIRNLYKIYLNPWLDARNKLVNENWEIGTDNRSASLGLRRLEAVLQTLKRMTRVRKFYILVEIIGPVIFASASLAYVFLNKNPEITEPLKQTYYFLTSLIFKIR